MYHVELTEKAKRALTKLDRPTAAMILGWIRKNLEGYENPRLHGSSLVANHRGEWRYRIGDYRLIVEIMDQRMVILVLNIGNRKDIYT